MLAALVVAVAACARDADLSFVGGKWWTGYTASWPHNGRIPHALFRIKGDQREVVDSMIESVYHYQPDCVAYQSGQHDHDVLLVCGDRVPLVVAETKSGEWTYLPLGLRRGIVTLPIDSLRSLALQQPMRR
ncbi:MAG: hypothetical protein JWO05_2520 [Gemmatimonadetes bacterium]|nr:hypothetical protein [Gemmatimonadota bacterium]